MFPFYIPLKTPENQMFSSVFRENIGHKWVNGTVDMPQSRHMTLIVELLIRNLFSILYRHVTLVFTEIQIFWQNFAGKFISEIHEEKIGGGGLIIYREGDVGGLIIYICFIK